MKRKYMYVVNGVKFVTLWAAKDWAQRIFAKSGLIVAVEAL